MISIVPFFLAVILTAISFFIFKTMGIRVLVVYFAVLFVLAIVKVMYDEFIWEIVHKKRVNNKCSEDEKTEFSQH